MAIGTVTVGDKYSAPFHNISCVFVSFAGDGAYPSGGTATFSKLAAILSALGGKKLLSVEAVGACGGYVPRYDYANDKLLVYESDNGGADGPLQESTTANLSGVTFQLKLNCV
jgi:hypothetical protein